MKQIEPKTLKGFRDFLPKEARKRQYVIDTLKQVFELYGFEPLETPALEYEEILSGKYGEEGDKLMYKFTDLGGRKVALRYDQTVPLARVVAQYGNIIQMPFKRYQISSVWRAENPQKGRFREFLQCDADIVGSSSPLSDAEVIALAAKAIEKLGFKKFKILINDRTNFEDIPKEAIIAFDKIKKIGREGVINELVNKDFSKDKVLSILQCMEGKKLTDILSQIFVNLSKLGIEQERYEFSPTLARGLDYYTGMIFEIEIEEYSGGSVCGGGRYDNLIGAFSGRDIPAVGFAFGFDRLIEAMDELKLFPDNLATTKVLVTIFPARNARAQAASLCLADGQASVADGSPEFKDKSIEICSRLRSNNINTELYLEEDASLDKQLKYADKKQIPYVIILGPEEAQQNVAKLKDMRTGEQKEISVDQISEFIR